MGAAWGRSLCDLFRIFDRPQQVISQSDVESGLMSRSTAVSANDQKKVCLHNA